MNAAYENKTSESSEVPSAPGRKNRQRLIRNFRRGARGEENPLVANLIHMTADLFEVEAEWKELLDRAIQEAKESGGEADQARGEMFDDLMRAAKQARGTADLIHRITRHDHANGTGERSPASGPAEDEGPPTPTAAEEIESASTSPKRAR